MSFTVKNTQSTTVEVVCTFKEIEGVNIDVIFDWTRMNITSGATAINRYKINVTGDYSTIFNLEITLKEKPVGTGDNQLLGAGTIINKVAFYSDSEGSLLDLRIADQADTPREASVLILYSHNDSMPFTPIKEFNGSSFYGVLPYGDYLVKAHDLESSIYAEERFILNETEHEITVNLALIGFGMFKLNFVGAVGINATIFNHVGEVEETKIYVELYNKDTGELIETSEAWYISPLPKTTTQRLSFWFAYADWIPNTKYIVRGVIEAGGIHIAYRSSDDFSMKSNSNTGFQITPELISIILGLSTIIGYIIYTQYYKKEKMVVLDEKHQ